MKTGIIGLPQVGKTSLFRILTKAKLDVTHSRDAHVGIARVPDERLDKLSALFKPKKTTHATVEYLDVAAIGQEALKESAYAQRLREVESLTHVLRAFEDPAIPHVGGIDPVKDARDVEADLIINDMVQIEKRMEGLEKDLKKLKSHLRQGVGGERGQSCVGVFRSDASQALSRFGRDSLPKKPQG